MIVNYVPFHPARRLEEYVGQAAPQGGMLLPSEGYEALAAAKATNRPPQLAVVGEEHCEDGRRYLRLGVTREWVEAATNFRYVDGQYRWVCPECSRIGGKHQRSCEYEA